MNHRFRPLPHLLAVCAALTLASTAHGSGAAGEGHGQDAPAKPTIKLASKADLKAAAQAEGKGAAKAGAADAKSAPAASVSMAELRDMIDQKIAEVRAQQEAAAVVKVTNRPPGKAKPQSKPDTPRNPALVNASYSPDSSVESAPAAPSEVRPVAPANRATKAKAPASAKARARAAAVSTQAAAIASGADGHDHHWDYTGAATGPESWGSLKSEFKQCMQGKRQSPIDIRDGIRVELEPIQFDYRPTPFVVVDNGHTVQVNLPPGNAITVSGRRYELLQFHFHRPSEERINGRQYEMVAHLVHKDTEGRLAVVAVLMDQGKAHPMVQLVWNSLPLERHTEQRSPVQMDLNLMLPEQRQYYTYMGSLTTPPCTEGVLWMVMKQPATLTHEQIAIFARLYPMNARPIQAASNRLIKDGQ